ncbi:transglutaminase domain-containing protein [Treponema pectinovorum]|uniref:transglutaminase domain-containing protein n=1 Tax=Treponema pectinovorum TaxID=164 RepID=UPI001659ADD2|nr:transglutaminase domain-containing protein [Treponema pectinovorum]
MKVDKLFFLLFRKEPLFRTGSVIFLILLILGLFSAVTWQARKLPEIQSVNPTVGSPGDLMVISGKNFGEIRTSSAYVEVGGSRITSSGYLLWTDAEIKFILPSNVQDGLVIVSTKSGKSKPIFFANKAGIPIEVPPDTKTSMPVITSFSPETVSVGQVLVLNGKNFGTIRNNAKVFFNSSLEDLSLRTNEKFSFITALEENYDYEYWSDSEIHVRVPDGAASGQIYVETEKGNSNLVMLGVKSAIGTKKFFDKKTYIVQVNTEIDDINSKGNSSLAVRIPYPTVSASQPLTNLTECSPKPVFENYQNTIIHHLELSKNSAKKFRFNQTFVIEDFAVQTEINQKNVNQFADKSRILYTNFTSQNKIIRSEDADYKTFASEIVKKENNPYLQAKILYDYIVKNFIVQSEIRKIGSEPKDLLKRKRGDAYDFAIVYTTLLRSLKIPAVTMSGILVDSELNTFNHWWCEFYIENFGWIPVDPSLGAGLAYKSFKQVEDPATFYFGNLDSQHIAFSKGFNEVKPTLSNSNSVYKERSYALQSIWEESTPSNINYSSLWNKPIVTGIY